LAINIFGCHQSDFFQQKKPPSVSLASGVWATRVQTDRSLSALSRRWVLDQPMGDYEAKCAELRELQNDFAGTMMKSFDLNLC
jgi:hypothetical protein